MSYPAGRGMCDGPLAVGEAVRSFNAASYQLPITAYLCISLPLWANLPQSITKSLMSIAAGSTACSLVLRRRSIGIAAKGRLDGGEKVGGSLENKASAVGARFVVRRAGLVFTPPTVQSSHPQQYQGFMHDPARTCEYPQYAPILLHYRPSLSGFPICRSAQSDTALLVR